MMRGEALAPGKGRGVGALGEESSLTSRLEAKVKLKVTLLTPPNVK